MTHVMDFKRELSANVLERFYVNGQWVAPATPRKLTLVSPVTEQSILQVPEAAPADIDQAVQAARQAFDEGPWPRLSGPERGAYLRKVADEMRKRQDLFVRTWHSQVAPPILFAQYLVPTAIALFDYYAGLAEQHAFTEERSYGEGHKARIEHEPVGVVGIVTPWNAPLVLLSYKLAAALAAGCTVVSKPSPETPLDALLLAECIDAAGIPPGVVNILPAGRETGDDMIRRPEFDKVSFTGSTAAGKIIAAACGERIARINLELGGKSAAVILDDADLDLAVQTLIPFSMPFSGQICFSLTRVLVSRKNMDAFLAKFIPAVQAVKVGDPADPQTQIGPLSSKRQFERVMGYIQKGKDEGATVATGGQAAAPAGQGYYVQPTVFTGVHPDMAIAQEEIFGPVVCVMPFDDEADAVRIANHSDYGLSGAVFSRDVERAYQVARRIRTGNVSINGLMLDPSIPFGGYKQSGLGRQGGLEGLLDYLECKAVYLPVR